MKTPTYRTWPDHLRLTNSERLEEMKNLLRGWGYNIPKDWILETALKNADGDYINAAHEVTKTLD